MALTAATNKLCRNAMDDRTPPAASTLERLAQQMGIEPEYLDANQTRVVMPRAVKQALLAAMGVPAATEHEARLALVNHEWRHWTGVLPPVVLHQTGQPLETNIVLPHGTTIVRWEVRRETGVKHAGSIAFSALDFIEGRAGDGRALERRRLKLKIALAPGYHRLRVTGAPVDAETAVISSPLQCFIPDALREGRRLWGVAVQLYAVRSERNWGIGDFTDLKHLVELFAAEGADVVGLNPLHALFTDRPDHISPYSPSSRLHLHVLYIDPTALPEFSDPAVQALVRTADFQSRLQAAREATLVDYAAVTALKLPVLEALFAAFRNAADAERLTRFRTFHRRNATTLEPFACFSALREHFSGADWRQWPNEFRDPHSGDVAAFAARHRDRVDFFAWMQWIADEQLGNAAEAARAAGMTIGLYRDLALGADPGGAELWAGGGEMVTGAQVGAPPDAFNPAGQDWGLPPFSPAALRAEAYRGFVRLIRANMRHAGALRLDHVMSLQHLFWIPAGASPAQGGYVSYPLEDLIAVVSLESQRQRCLVIGEDLGTVPDGFRARMAEANILSYRVLAFEQHKSGNFISPDRYPRLSLATIGSHDMPTLSGWWAGRDIALREQLGLYPEEGEAARQQAARRKQRQALQAALRRAGIDPGRDESSLSQDGAVAIHRFLAQTESGIAIVQIDDLTDERDQVNLPGTWREHPNWQRRLSLSLETLPDQPRARAIIQAMKERRPRPGP